MSKTVFKKDDIFEGQTIADFKCYYKATMIKMYGTGIRIEQLINGD